MNMKKIISWGMMLAAAFTLTNCAKEIDAPVQESESNGYPFEIIASTVDTKTVNDGMSTRWADGDQINVFHAVCDGEDYKNNGAFEVKETESGNFKGELCEKLDPKEEYDWYAFYPYKSQIASPKNEAGWAYIGNKNGITQEGGYGKTAHLASSNCPLYGVAKAVPAADTPSIEMQHLSSVVAINVTNMTDEPLTVTGATFTANEPIVGSFYIDFSGVPTYTSSEEQYVSNAATVNVIGGTALGNGESGVLYLVVKPFTAAKDSKLYLSVNGYEKELTMPQDVTFTAGKIKTLNFAYDKVEEPVEPEPVWTLVTDASTLAVGDEIIIAAKDYNYAVGPASSNGNNRTQAAITKSGNILTSSDGVTILTLQAGTEDGTYALYTGTKYLYAASNSSNYLKEKADKDANGSWKISISSDGTASVVAQGTYTRNTMQYNQTSSLFACYAGASQKAVVIYKQMLSSGEGGGETPEPDPEERTLVSIVITDQTTLYTVGDTFEFDGTVTATYSDESTATVTPTSVSAPDMTTKGTKTVTVTYAEGDLTVSAEYEIEVVEVQDLPKGIASIKSKATSNEETDFTVTLTDAVVTYVSGSSAYIEDAEAGILVYKSGHGLAAGDKLNGEVSGKVKLYNSLREVTAVDYSNATKTTGAEIPVTVLTLAELNADGAYDKYENMRIKIENATVSAAKQISQNGQTYALYFKNTSVTGFDIDNTIDVIGYPSKYNADIQFNVWENAVVKKASKTTITGVSDLTVAVGASKVINASASSGEKVTYVSADPTIATVDKTGNVTGVAEGETTITVSVPANDVYPAAEQTCKVTVTAGEVAKVWTLVTDASTLKAGDQIVIVATNSNYAMSSTQNSNNRAQEAVIKSGNTISEPGTSVQKLILEAGKTAGTFAFNTGSGYLYAASSSKNYLRTETTLSDNSSWNITITTAGVATIKATGSNTRNWIRYNSSNNPPIFSCYGSGQADISIYRYE